MAVGTKKTVSQRLLARAAFKNSAFLLRLAGPNFSKKQCDNIAHWGVKILANYFRTGPQLLGH